MNPARPTPPGWRSLRAEVEHLAKTVRWLKLERAVERLDDLRARQERRHQWDRDWRRERERLATMDRMDDR